MKTLNSYMLVTLVVSAFSLHAMEDPYNDANRFNHKRHKPNPPSADEILLKEMRQIPEHLLLKHSPKALTDCITKLRNDAEAKFYIALEDTVNKQVHGLLAMDIRNIAQLINRPDKKVYAPDFDKFLPGLSGGEDDIIVLRAMIALDNQRQKARTTASFCSSDIVNAIIVDSRHAISADVAAKLKALTLNFNPIYLGAMIPNLVLGEVTRATTFSDKYTSNPPDADILKKAHTQITQKGAEYFANKAFDTELSAYKNELLVSGYARRTSNKNS